MTGALFIWLTVSASAAPGPCPADRIDATGVVEYVHDGDTLHLRDGRKLRVIGLNTPELARDDAPAEPLALSARERLRELLPVGSKVQLRLGKDRRDRHGRLLAHVFSAAGDNVTAKLLEEGLGFAIAIAPNLWAHSCYFEAESRARQATKGIWQLPYYEPRPLNRLEPADAGFRRIQGRLVDAGTSRKALWLNFDGPGAVRIPKNTLHHFDSGAPQSWVGKRVLVRGWLNYYKSRWIVNVTHPAMIELLD